jgi:hypothetical protein
MHDLANRCIWLFDENFLYDFFSYKRPGCHNFRTGNRMLVHTVDNGAEGRRQLLTKSNSVHNHVFRREEGSQKPCLAMP